MTDEITAVRGPVINSIYNPYADDSYYSLTYLKDALIILNGTEILEFGPTNSLKHKIENFSQIKPSERCRIISSTVY